MNPVDQEEAAGGEETVMSTIENVTGTAFVVAEFRADENTGGMPLYQDSVVRLFLNEDTRRAAARVAARFPAAKELIQIRTKYFDDALEKSLRLGCRQVLILGSGLDTRAVRKRTAGVAYFEIDDPATLKIKEACYDREGFDIDLTLIPGDYVSDGLIELLAANGFDFDLPSYVIWEGNTMYLPFDTVNETLTELRDYLGRFRVSFDYMAQSVVSMSTGDSGVTSFAASFAAMGAPWLTGIDDIWRLARELDLSVIENCRASDLLSVYRPGSPITSPIFSLFSMCTLGR